MMIVSKMKLAVIIGAFLFCTGALAQEDGLQLAQPQAVQPQVEPVACRSLQCFMDETQTMPTFLRAFWKSPSLLEEKEKWLGALRDVINTPSVESVAFDLQGMRPETFAKAMQARACAVEQGDVSASYNTIAIIDFDIPSTEKRMWVVDLEKKTTVMKEWVSHGSGSGANIATSFSNQPESFQTSLGLFKASETYQGKHGLSMRLDGLEERINDNARARAIVMHSADYVNPVQARRQGRLGRSQGCPAVRPAVMQKMAHELSDQGLIFAYSSKSGWDKKSPYAECIRRAVKA